MLERDSTVLLDPHFLGALHAELETELGVDEAGVALFQMGFLHGLQDAMRALVATEAHGRQAPRAIVPPLRMHCWSRPGAAVGTLEIEGAWPDCSEASAHLETLGRADRACHLSMGYTSGWLSGTLDADLVAIETTCGAAGEPSCRFVAREAEVWRAGGDPGVANLLEALPFGLFRAAVTGRSLVEHPQGAPNSGRAGMSGGDGGIDRGAPLIHIWGPVMVIPYSGPEEALAALDLIGRDPGAADVSVVVVDLSGAVIDEAFGALALEQIVQTVEAWGAEAIFAEPASLSAGVLADLDHAPLLVEKDLDHAVAAAFQIAQSQRRLM